MNLDILIVAYRAKKALVQTVSSIAYFSEPGYRLTVYENTEKNYPLTWIWNKFVESSGRPYIAICNPDIFVSPGWDTEALECFKLNPMVCAVNPLSNYHFHYDALKAVEDPFAGGAEKATEGVYEKVEYLKRTYPGKRFVSGVMNKLLWGHCYIFRKESWGAIGGFDEQYQFGWNEYDFSERLVKSGKQLAVCSHAFAYHLINESSKEARTVGDWDEARNQPKFNKPPDGVKFSEV